MFINKKGMTAGFIVSIMITLIAFIVISGVLLRFVNQDDNTEAEMLCKQSIALRVATTIKLGSEDSWAIKAKLKPVPALCRTIDKRTTGDREKIKKEVADSMARCWEMFGEGKYEELLHSSDFSIIPAVFDFGETENKCFNCYTINIAQDDIKGGPIMAGEMENYLTTHKYKNKGKTYLDYIQTYGGPGRVVFTVPAILPREGYAISMMPKNREVGDGEAWKGAGKIIVGAVVVVGVVVVGTLIVACVVGTAGVCAAPAAAVATAAEAAATATAAAATSTAVTASGASATAIVTAAAEASAAATVAAETAAATAAAASSGMLGSGGAALAGAGLTTKVAVVAGAAKLGTGALLTGSAMAYSGAKNILTTFYGERDVSSIYLGNLQIAQEMCGSGDIAGE